MLAEERHCTVCIQSAKSVDITVQTYAQFPIFAHHISGTGTALGQVLSCMCMSPENNF